MVPIYKVRFLMKIGEFIKRWENEFRVSLGGMYDKIDS